MLAFLVLSSSRHVKFVLVLQKEKRGLQRKHQGRTSNCPSAESAPLSACPALFVTIPLPAPQALGPVTGRHRLAERPRDARPRVPFFVNDQVPSGEQKATLPFFPLAIIFISVCYL